MPGGISLSGPSSRYTPEKLAELRDIALLADRRLSQQLSATSVPALSRGRRTQSSF